MMKKRREGNHKKVAYCTMVAAIIAAVLLMIGMESCNKKEVYPMRILFSCLDVNWNVDFPSNEKTSSEEEENTASLDSRKEYTEDADENAEEVDKNDENSTQQPELKPSTQTTPESDEVQDESTPQSPPQPEKRLKKTDVIVQIPKNLVFDKKEKTVKVTLKEGVTAKLKVTYHGKNLVNKKPVNAGKVEAIVEAEGTGEYSGSSVKLTKKYKILPKKILEEDVKIEVKDSVYDGSAQENVQVHFKGEVTGEVAVDYYFDTDSQHKLEEIFDAGSYFAKITVNGKGNYTGRVQLERRFEVFRKDIKEEDLEIIGPKDAVFDGETKGLFEKISFKEGTTGEVVSIQSYCSSDEQRTTSIVPINAGSYVSIANVRGTGNYKGELAIEREFTISKKKTTYGNMVFESETFEYNAARIHSISVKGEWSEGVENIHYENNDKIDIGNHTVAAIFEMNPNYEQLEPLYATIKIVDQTVENPDDGSQKEPDKPDAGEEDDEPSDSDHKGPEDGDDTNQGNDDDPGDSDQKEPDESDDPDEPSDSNHKGPEDGDDTNQGNDDEPKDFDQKAPNELDKPENPDHKGPEKVKNKFVVEQIKVVMKNLENK